MDIATLAPVRDCLSEWKEQQGVRRAELDESFQALEAFQRSLESWQQRLSEQQQNFDQQLEELVAQEQSQAEQDSSLATEHTALVEKLDSAKRKCEQLQADLTRLGAEKLIAESDNALMATDTEAARRQISELEAQVERQNDELIQQQEHWSREFNRVVKRLEQQPAAAEAPPEPAPSSTAPATPAPAPASQPDPVLGSVAAQFGKLRQQRAERGQR